MESEQKLHSGVNECVQKYPTRTAVIYDDGQNVCRLTYEEMNEESVQVSKLLSFIGSRSIVGYAGALSVSIPSILIGILNATHAFSVIDINAPSRWIQTFVRKLNIQWIITGERIVKKHLRKHGIKCQEFTSLNLHQGTIILLHVEEVEHHLISCNNNQWDIAYAIHTSGTTGEPKVIRVPHSCIVPNIIDFRTIFQIKIGDIVNLTAPLTFDPSIVEIFITLTSGATLLIETENVKISPSLFLEVFQRHSISVLQSTPSFVKRLGKKNIHEILLSDTTSLRVLAFGGEPCPDHVTLFDWKHVNNKTLLYNIYGISEVSSWATVQEITLNQDFSSEINLGHALSDTILEIRDEYGNCITEGEGELYIGGTKRLCLIDEENLTNSMCTMRPSGDIVSIRRNNMSFVGRRDSVIKRYGKKVALSDIESKTLVLGCVENCTALYELDEEKIWLFVVSLNTCHSTVRKTILQSLQEELPKHSVPDIVAFLPILPVTAHGKVDHKFLLNHRYDYLSPQSGEQKQDIKAVLEKKWKAILNLSELDERSTFVENGGNSLNAVQLVQEISFLSEHPLPLLLDKLLQKTFADVLAYLVQGTDSSIGINTNEELLDQDQFHSSINQQTITETYGTNSKLTQLRNFSNKENKQNKRLKICHQQEFNVIKRFANLDFEVSSPICYVHEGCNVLKNESFYLEQVWKYDLGKCVDASPLILQFASHSTIYVGSHSHEFAALSLDTGQPKWKEKLGDRIESSANVSACGNYILVGCYDFFLYCLNVHNGEVNWRFETGGEIKSSPCVNVRSNTVYVGSHDHRVYAIAVEDGTCKWKTTCFKGSVFSSPCIWYDLSLLYIASLDGSLCAVSLEMGYNIWSHETLKPIFSSPSAFQNGVCVGCVDGNLYYFSHEGKLLRKLTVDGPIFSSPVIFTRQQAVETEKLVLFGSHDSHIYCFNLDTGELHWKQFMSSPVYSTPYLFKYDLQAALSNCTDCLKPDLNGMSNIVAVCSVSTDGHLVMYDIHKGIFLSDFQFPGEIFSSPVMIDGFILVGCRDNNVYCLKLLNTHTNSSKEKK